MRDNTPTTLPWRLEEASVSLPYQSPAVGSEVSGIAISWARAARPTAFHHVHARNQHQHEDHRAEPREWSAQLRTVNDSQLGAGGRKCSFVFGFACGEVRQGGNSRFTWRAETPLDRPITAVAIPRRSPREPSGKLVVDGTEVPPRRELKVFCITPMMVAALP